MKYCKSINYQQQLSIYNKRNRYHKSPSKESMIAINSKQYSLIGSY